MQLRHPKPFKAVSEPKTPQLSEKKVPYLTDEPVMLDLPGKPKPKAVSFQRRRARRGGRSGAIPVLPPSLTMFPPHRMRIQYTSTSTSSKDITVENVIQACGGVATSSTVAVAFHSAIRIRRIRSWAAASDSFCSIEWGQTNTGYAPDETKSQLVPAGVTVTGGQLHRPPAGSQASFWNNHAASSVILFTVSATSGTVLELEVDATFANSYLASSVTTTGLTAGDVYFPHLDGAAGIWAPGGIIHTY